MGVRSSSTGADTPVDPSAAPRWAVPRLTADLPGSGGVLYAEPEHFRVEERIPYPPSGSGTHLFVRIEKRGIDTLAAIRRLAEATGVRREEIGAAGLKDRWAVAEQWLSLPDGPDRETALAGIEDETLRVCATTRHEHKLRKGHVAANRFVIRLSEVPAGGLERARATLAALVQRGLPNAFGPQRFGRSGDNPAEGLALLRGPRRRPSRLGSLLLSSVQSAVFNHVLAARIRAGTFATALLGDVMQKHDTGGVFDVADPDAEQPRVQSLAISPTGPMVGKRLRRPTGTPEALERAAEAEWGLTEEDLPRFGRGTRRLLRVALDPESAVEAVDDSTLALTFALPSGSYATTVLDELVKPDGGPFARQPT